MTSDQASDITDRIRAMFEEYDGVPWQLVVVTNDDIMVGGSMNSTGKLAVIRCLTDQLIQEACRS